MMRSIIIKHVTTTECKTDLHKQCVAVTREKGNGRSSFIMCICDCHNQ